jgi:serine/threonine kinase PknH
VDEVAFGRYRLIGLIGEGGMGKVYRAHDTMMNRAVAIKVLPPEMAAEPGYEDRFRREAQTSARLIEPHIIPIYEAGEIDGRLFLVMPIIEGVDLHTLLRRDGPMPPQRAVRIIEQLAAALDAAHAAGLVHRDIKPSNALVTARDFVYLIDFGIAHDTTATRLTNTGMMVGTLAYMAPERFTSGIADARSDVYALACVLQECLTGNQPYPGDSMEQQIAGHLTLDPPRPSAHRHNVPTGFDEVIARGMAKKPEHRYQSADELATGAHRALTVPPSHPPPTAPTLFANPPRSATQQRPPVATAGVPYYPQGTQSGGYPSPQIGTPPPGFSTPPPGFGTPPPGFGTPPPGSGSRKGLAIAAIAAGVVIVVAIAAAGYLLTRPKSQPSTNSQPFTTSPPTTTSQTVAPVEATALPGLLLPVDQINSVMGATGMTVTGPSRPTAMYDDSPYVANKACLLMEAPAQRQVYGSSGSSTLQGLELHEPDNNWTHLVIEEVVLFATPQAANAVYTTSAQQWPACQQYTYTVSGKPDEVETVGPVSNTNGTLSATRIRSGGDSTWVWGWETCQRAMTVANNVVIDVLACSTNRSDAQSGSAVNVAHQIAAKVTT